MPDLSLSPRLASGQRAALSPRQQQAARLLQLSTPDFAQQLRDLMASNPFLEVDEAEGSGPHADAAGEPDPQDTPDPRAEREDWSERPARSTGPARESEPQDFLFARPSLAAHLGAQIDLLRLTPRDRALAHLLAGSLDAAGYLREAPQDCAGTSAAGTAFGFLGEEPEPDDDEWRIALSRIQSLEPCGVGARDLAECLLLQLRECRAPIAPLAAKLVTHHLPRVAAGDVRHLALLAHCSVAEASQALALIRSLDPRPGEAFEGTLAPYAVADVRARRLRGRWVAELDGRTVPRLRVNQSYVDALRRSAMPPGSPLEQQVHEASWAVRNIEQRCTTILAVAQAVVDHQQAWFDHGPLALRPLTLAQVAERVGMHESTVCRVTNNKFLDTPHGLVELKRFFSRPLQLVGGGECTAAAVRTLLADLLAQEPPGAPLSDAELARRLQQQGVKVARRTVTNYRQQLKVPPVERRLRQSVAAVDQGE